MTAVRKGEMVSLGASTVPVFRIDRQGACFIFRKPDGFPCLVADRSMPLEDIVRFAKRRERAVATLSHRVQGRYLDERPEDDYSTGTIVNLLGLPYVVCADDYALNRLFNGSGRSAREDAALYEDMSAIVIRGRAAVTAQTRKQACSALLDSIYLQEIRKVLSDCLGRSGVARPEVPDMKLVDTQETWVRFDDERSTLYVLRELQGYPSECTEYAFVNAVVSMLAPDDDGRLLDVTLEKACIPRTRVENLLRSNGKRNVD